MRNAQGSDRARVGVFVGLATLDVVHRIAAPPGRNEKITAADQFVSAGGPAANAAVTFAALGGRAVLVTALGTDPVADLVRTDLTTHGVEVVDVAAGTTRPVPVSAVSVLDATGERSVVSLDAVASDADPPAHLDDVIAAADVVLADGHHPRLGVAALAGAAAHDIPRVVDAGRWKPVMADLARHATDMVCSADFRTPAADSAVTTAAALLDGGVPTVVVTHGGDPVEWWAGGRSGAVEVPAVPVHDTLGAGDAFHGAYCYHADVEVAERIRRAIDVAGLRVSTTGPRSWLAGLGTRGRYP